MLVKVVGCLVGGCLLSRQMVTGQKPTRMVSSGAVKAEVAVPKKPYGRKATLKEEEEPVSEHSSGAV